MITLSILISQYNEDSQQITPLLNSISMQQGYNFSQLEILIGNDGSSTTLSKDFLQQYSNLSIQYLMFPHRGLAGVRQNLFEYAQGQYVMWCDGDDMFATFTALSVINNLMQQKPDAIFCNFLEEIYIPYTHQYYYNPHPYDTTFVHGKIYSKQYLIQNNIHWNQLLGPQQDSCFNVFALHMTSKKVYCNQPIYIWKWNPKSETRHDQVVHAMRTWPDFINSFDTCISDFLIHNIRDKAIFYSYYCLYTTYIQMMQVQWQQNTTPDYDNKVYLRLKNFYKKYE